MDEPAKTSPAHPHPHKSFWLWVMCLTGVDYFSTLGYQPSIAFDAAGLLAPLATVILVLVTLFGALPVYSYVARQSPRGQGSIAMLEKLVHGWGGKILVLVLLGFAATDFVITKTLSAADAGVHLISNPLWPFPLTGPGDEAKQRMIVTMFMLVLLGAMFLRGFREAISLAVVLVAIYLVLNAIVIGCGLAYLVEHPALFDKWYNAVVAGEWHQTEPLVHGNGWAMIALASILIFPKLALGLSGFETGVAVMPLVRGDDDDTEANPAGRIRNTRLLLVTAAIIMSFNLLGSSLVVATIIEPAALVREHGATAVPPAAGRALAYLAHGEGPIRISPITGEIFGTIYDLSTVAILWFAGASAMAGLLNLVPQYLPRYGMAPEWAGAIRPLVILLTAVNLLVTYIFNADVEAQGGAYATGVLVLMCSACVAAVIQRYRESDLFWLFRVPWYFVGVALVFVYTTVAVIVEKPEGIKIASCFIVAVIVASILSRTSRSKELRFSGFQFKDSDSRFLWESLKHVEFPVLVPHRPGGRDLLEKERIIRREHRLGPEIPILFVEAHLGDTSDFYQAPEMEVKQEEGRYVLKITRCASIAHVIAALGLELAKVGKPPEIHFGWSMESPMAANLGFLLFGEGNVPWLVHELIQKAEPDPLRQPRIIIG